MDNLLLPPEGQLVFVPDPKEGFILAQVIDIQDNESALIKIQGSGAERSLNLDSILPADQVDDNHFEDHCALKFLNAATLLDNSKNRFLRNEIYTYVANILISINPYKSIPELYSVDTMHSYAGKSLGILPPHIFAIADKAYNEMKRCKTSQSIIVSGESGAGKTESQKQVLRYICESWGKTAGNIEQRILETNPILEAFGNAKTTRNNNSSRFGKFVEIHFDDDNMVSGGYVSHYLLEKSRIVSQSPNERNYHVFYQLLGGATDEWRKEFKLETIQSYNYLKKGLCQFFSNSETFSLIPARAKDNDSFSLDSMVDDLKDFEKLGKALHVIGFDDEKIKILFATVAGILHLGNITFEEAADNSQGGSVITDNSLPSLTAASSLLGIEESTLRNELTARIMQATRGGVKGTAISVQLKPHEAGAARDALSKKIYGKLFDGIVASINKCILISNSKNFIGVLDIAGFEFFQRNCFEQFCINYSNEKLQQFFNDRILKQEQELYQKEGLNVAKIEFSDNLDCINLMEAKGTGIIDILNEEARLPKPISSHFTDCVHQTHNNNFRIDIPRKSAVKDHRNIKNDEGFVIRHFAGSVCYETKHFLEKNNDSLHMSLEILLETTSNSLLQTLFPPFDSDSKVAKTTKLSSPTVSSKFKSQLDELIKKLDKTGTNFVRCMKPNNEMISGKFDGQQILNQLLCSGMIDVLELMQGGFPSRTVFKELYDSYASLLPSNLRNLDPRTFAKCLFKVVGLQGVDYKFGLTKVFFRPGKFAQFDKLMKQDAKEMQEMIGKIQFWLNKGRWVSSIYGVISLNRINRNVVFRRKCATTVQAQVRGFVARKKFTPLLINKRIATDLQKNFVKLKELGLSLKTNQEDWTFKMNEIGIQIDFIAGLFTKNDFELYNDNLKLFPEIACKFASLYNDMVIQKEKDDFEQELKVEKDKQDEMTKMNAELKAKEEARLAQEMILRKEQEEKTKHLEEQRLLLEEEAALKKRLQEIEEKHKKLAAENAVLHRQSKDIERKKLDSITAVGYDESNQESSELIKPKINCEEPVLLSTFDLPILNENVGDMNELVTNLPRMKYEILRNTINTSDNKKLVMACRAEFHRRLHKFQSWKNSNKSREEKAKADMGATPVRYVNRSDLIDSEKREIMLRKMREFKERRNAEN
uniref:Myosin motor domain-containing protein n=1 Tax=Rhabditophanes sp. KR3021 TaxID=114890 RepID=A0AC35U1J6_9BILA